MFEKITDHIILVKNNTNAPILFDTQSALDLTASARYAFPEDAQATSSPMANRTRIILQKADIAEPFFDLRTKLAGDILQKFVNYGIQIAVVGDFSVYTSQSLKNFIYESNKGTVLYFAATLEEAVAKLSTP